MKLKKSNSASTLLGLSILLYPDSRQYEMGMNNYFGFRVRKHLLQKHPQLILVSTVRSWFTTLTASLR